MHIILGGTGHVGSAVAEALLSRGEAVTVVARHRGKARSLEMRGAQIEAVEVRDAEALRRIYRQGQRLFMLNPPADPSTDTQAQERETVASMLRALADSGITKVVAESTFGARPGELMGDLNVLYEMEQGLERSGVPVSIIRAAYYMSNWESALASAKEEGILRAFFPADLKIPMVAPRDLGEVAARLLTEPVERTERVYVEGPVRYSPADVARAFSAALGREIRVETIPESGWIAAFKSLGFSERAATSYANMTRTVCEENFPPVGSTVHGAVSLDEHVREMVTARA